MRGLHTPDAEPVDDNEPAVAVATAPKPVDDARAQVMLDAVPVEAARERALADQSRLPCLDVFGLCARMMFSISLRMLAG